MEERGYEFKLPTSLESSMIKVLGVGGGGSNAVEHMFNQGIRDVDFVVCNTDKQHLRKSNVPYRLQIGEQLTRGLGAGADPQRGANAAKESREAISELLRPDNTRMLFITAGMGGGTGTGAAPVIAEIARELKILSVGIVTMPFKWEGEKKRMKALEGISLMKMHCDTVLVVLNERLREMYKEMSVRNAFAKANDVLTTAAKGIAEIITVPGIVNVDFEDVNTVLQRAGDSVMGSARAAGERRALRAVEEASRSPLLNNQKIYGAKKILLSMSSGEEQEMTMDEVEVIVDYVTSKIGPEADVIFGQGLDPLLGDQLSVTLIATGFETEELRSPLFDSSPKKIYDLNAPEAKAYILSSVKQEARKKEGNQELGLGNLPATNQQQRQEELSDGLGFESEGLGSKNKNGSGAEEEGASAHQWELSETSLGKEKSGEGGEYKEEEEPCIANISVHRHEEAQEKAAALEDLEGAAVPVRRRCILEQQRKERIVAFAGIKEPDHFGDESIQKKLDRPAYQRRNSVLPEVPHSARSNLSRFYLDADEHIIGKNRFLHDNVD